MAPRPLEGPAAMLDTSSNIEAASVVAVLAGILLAVGLLVSMVPEMRFWLLELI
jgi:hypothetical protein